MLLLSPDASRKDILERILSTNGRFVDRFLPMSATGAYRQAHYRLMQYRD